MYTYEDLFKHYNRVRHHLDPVHVLDSTLQGDDYRPFSCQMSISQRREIRNAIADHMNALGVPREMHRDVIRVSEAWNLISALKNPITMIMPGHTELWIKQLIKELRKEKQTQVASDAGDSIFKLVGWYYYLWRIQRTFRACKMSERGKNLVSK